MKKIITILCALLFLAGAYITITDAMMRWWHLTQATQYLFNIAFFWSAVPFAALIVHNVKSINYSDENNK